MHPSRYIGRFLRMWSSRLSAFSIACISTACSWAHAGTVTVDIGSSISGAAPPSTTFVGLSMEKSTLSGSQYSGDHPGLAKLFRNLGPSVLRVGGNSVDRTVWDAAGDANGHGMTPGYVSPPDVDRFASFVKATGWKVIYGINYASETSSVIADEARYVSASLGDSLIGFEIGNEPDLYVKNHLRPAGFTFEQFLDQWSVDAAAVRSDISEVAFAGPATAFDVKNYTVPFAKDVGSKLGLLTQHYYIKSSCPDPSSNYTPTIAFMLTPDNALPGRLQNIVAAANQSGVTGGARMAEANSFYSCTDANGQSQSGAPGVSNSFASALWAVDFLFENLRYGMRGVNFHTGGTANYAPIQISKGDVTSVQSEYYGLWLFARSVDVTGGEMLDTTIAPIKPDPGVRAYAIRDGSGQNHVVLLNEGDTDAQVFVKDLSAKAATAALTRMIAPSLGDTVATDIKINGAAFNTDGSWTSAPYAIQQEVFGQSLVVSLPAASALLIETMPDVIFANDFE